MSLKASKGIQVLFYIYEFSSAASCHRELFSSRKEGIAYFSHSIQWMFYVENKNKLTLNEIGQTEVLQIRLLI